MHFYAFYRLGYRLRNLARTKAKHDAEIGLYGPTTDRPEISTVIMGIGIVVGVVGTLLGWLIPALAIGGTVFLIGLLVAVI